MAIKPILFNTEMVLANLEGRKSCTRRLVSSRQFLGMLPDKCKNAAPDEFLKGKRIMFKPYCDMTDAELIMTEYKAPYQPGDILYVRETWKKAPNGYYYYESWQRSNIADITKWHPSIHMPKEAARIWLKVTDVRVERLQEMKPVDVIKEGAYPDCWDCLNTYGESGSQCCYGTEEQCSQCDEVMMEWEKLWNSTIKKSDLDRYGWTANPWVWVIEFERCEKPEGV
jgi:hypothetical protein|nr:MAG TPA: ASCH domain protein [Caudoviricetes sp.]